MVSLCLVNLILSYGIEHRVSARCEILKRRLHNNIGHQRSGVIFQVFEVLRGIADGQTAVGQVEFIHFSKMVWLTARRLSNQDGFGIFLEVDGIGEKSLKKIAMEEERINQQYGFFVDEQNIGDVGGTLGKRLNEIEAYDKESLPEGIADLFKNFPFKYVDLSEFPNLKRIVGKRDVNVTRIINGQSLPSGIPVIKRKIN